MRSPKSALPQAIPPVLTITLNPAIDLHFDLPEIGKTKIVRALRTSRAAGGKGLNVARMLGVLGIPASAAIALGGPDAEVFQSLLENLNLDCPILPAPGAVRTNITLWTPTPNRSLKINQAGPQWKPSDWPPVRKRLAELARGRKWVVVAGAPPPGLPVAAYQEILADAKQAGAMTAIDAAGPALLKALGAKPDLVRINRSELAETLGCSPRSLRSDRALIAAARRLMTLGARIAVIADGPRAACLATASEIHRLTPPAVQARSAMGGGDALMAGILRVLLKSPENLAAALSFGIACGAARMERSETEFPKAKRVRELMARAQSA